MPVQTIVTAANTAAMTPRRPITPSVTPKKIQPMPNTAAGTKVAIDMTPSRDSHDDPNCETAPPARWGRPRGNPDETSPPAASTKAVASAANPKPPLAGSNPSGTASPINSSSAKPAPDAVVKNTIESAGCIERAQRDSSRSTQRNSPLPPVSGAGAASATRSSGSAGERG